MEQRTIRKRKRRTLALIAVGAALISTMPSSAGAPPTEWRDLFNGKDLSGWKFVGTGELDVLDGMIETGRLGQGLLYWGGGEIGDCVLRVVFRMRHDNDNSGVFIRIPIEPREEAMPVNYGIEVQIDNHPERSGEDEYHSTGTLYSMTKPLAQAWLAGPDWNTMDIVINGPRTLVVLNGVTVTDYREGDVVPDKKFRFEPERGPRPARGWIGLQSHGPNDIVLFKRVAVRALSAEEAGGAAQPK